KYNQIRMSGDSLGADSMGFSWSKLITAPMALAALPAAATVWAVKKSGLPGSGTLAKVLQVPVSLSQAVAARGGWGGQLGVPGGAPAAAPPPGYGPGYPAPGAPGAPGAPPVNPAAYNA